MTVTAFRQSAPQLGNPLDSDRVLRSFLERHLTPQFNQEAFDELRELAQVITDELSPQQAADRHLEPRCEAGCGWHRTGDRIIVTPLWKKAHAVATTFGLIADAYEGRWQPAARLIQFAKAYLLHPASDAYCWSLAMTDGAVAALLKAPPSGPVTRAITHLTSRAPDQSWTCSAWLTETSGGSDLGALETVAVEHDHHWQLHGSKSFVAAAHAQTALILARPEGNPPGARGLGLFLAETAVDNELHPALRARRLRPTLGQRHMPIAELTLRGLPAVLIGGSQAGIGAIAPMVEVMRVWNGVSAISLLQRALSLARDYANRRIVDGEPLAESPLHQTLLAGVQARFEGAFQLVFHVVRLLGVVQRGAANAREQQELGLLVPLGTLLANRTALIGITQLMEVFGGAGQTEDTGLPALIRDAQGLSISAGTASVLARDALRSAGDDPVHFVRLADRFCARAIEADHPSTRGAVAAVQRMVEAIEQLVETVGNDRDRRLAALQRMATRTAELTALSLLIDHAGWEFRRCKDRRPAYAASRLAADLVAPMSAPDLDRDRALASDIYV